MRCLSVLPLALLALPASADAQTATGTLSGTIRDTTSAVLPGVIVTIRNAATGATRSVTTDGEGRYRIVNVEPGGYELRAQLDGFRTVVRNPVVISVGGMSQSDIEMTVGAVAETVTVQVEAPLIEPSKTDLSRHSGSAGRARVRPRRPGTAGGHRGFLQPVQPDERQGREHGLGQHRHQHAAGGAVRIRHPARRVQSVPDADWLEGEVLASSSAKHLGPRGRVLSKLVRQWKESGCRQRDRDVVRRRVLPVPAVDAGEGRRQRA